MGFIRAVMQLDRLHFLFFTCRLPHPNAAQHRQDFVSASARAQVQGFALCLGFLGLLGA